MRKLTAFTQITLDGYFASSDGTLDWAHTRSQSDPEFQEFVGENAKSGGALLFGRRTYEMMVSYWPTPLAREHDPVVAEGMNRMPKFVASRTLQKPTWKNTEVLSGELVVAVKRLKQEPGDDIAILGSGSIVTTLSDANLIDEYQVVLNPVALGGGRTHLAGLQKPLNLKLKQTRTFENGNVFLRYVRAR